MWKYLERDVVGGRAGQGVSCRGRRSGEEAEPGVVLRP